jgi:hypothetical protein
MAIDVVATGMAGLCWDLLDSSMAKNVNVSGARMVEARL